MSLRTGGSRATWGPLPVRAWRRFWFAPVDARALAVMRILLGLVLVVNQVSLLPRLGALLGDDGVLPIETAHAMGMPVRLSIYDLATTPEALLVVHGLGLVVVVLYALGWRTTWTGWLSLLVVVSLYHRDRFLMDSGDKLLRLMTLYMALVPAGRAWSLDALRRRRQGAPELSPVAPAVAHRLVQLQLAWMYFHAGWDKLRDGDWQAGRALFYTWSDTGLHVIPAVGRFFLDTSLGRDLTWWGGYIAMGWELSFWALVLWRRTRWLALGMGLLFHLQIGTLMGIATFSAVSCWGYLAYVRPSTLGTRAEALLQRLRRAS